MSGTRSSDSVPSSRPTSTTKGSKEGGRIGPFVLYVSRSLGETLPPDPGPTVNKFKRGVTLMSDSSGVTERFVSHRLTIDVLVKKKLT